MVCHPGSHTWLWHSHTGEESGCVAALERHLASKEWAIYTNVLSQHIPVHVTFCDETEGKGGQHGSVLSEC